MKSINIKTKLYKWSGEKASWYFLDVPKKEIETMLGHPIKRRTGWGSIPVRITVGETIWKSSVFPSKTGVYVLPVKASIRKAENLTEGTMVQAELRAQ